MQVEWQEVVGVPTLAGDEVHVWRLPHEATDDSLLSPDERVRAIRLAVPEARQRFVSRRTHLRRLLGCYLGTDPAMLRFETGEAGKPTLAPDHTRGPPFRFNLSESYPWLLIAVSRTIELGVDIERCDATRDLAVLKEVTLTPRERAGFDAVVEADKLRAFYLLWTAKEAVLKATGKGLTLSLQAFEVPLELHQGSGQVEIAKLGTWSFASLEPAEGHMACIANAGDALRPRFLKPV